MPRDLWESHLPGSKKPVTSFQLQDYNWIPQSLPTEQVSGFSYLTRHTLPCCGRKPCCHNRSLRSVLQPGEAAGCSRESVYASLNGLQQSLKWGYKRARQIKGDSRACQVSHATTANACQVRYSKSVDLTSPWMPSIKTGNVQTALCPEAISLLPCLKAGKCSLLIRCRRECAPSTKHLPQLGTSCRRFSAATAAGAQSQA